MVGKVWLERQVCESNQQAVFLLLCFARLLFLFHCRKCDVQVAHGGLWKALCGLTLFKESKTTARLLAGVSHLDTEGQPVLLEGVEVKN